MYLDCQWPWGPAKAVQSLPTPFKRLLSSTVLPFHLSQVSGSQWDGWAALYLTMYFLSDSVGTLRWWKFKSISKWFIIQWEIQKQQRYWICCFPCFLSKIISGKEHFLLAFFFFLPAFSSRSVLAISNGRWILGWWPWGSASSQWSGFASLLHSPEWRKSGAILSQGVCGWLASWHWWRYV